MLNRYLGLLNGDYGRLRQLATWLAHVLLAVALAWPLGDALRDTLRGPQLPARVAPTVPAPELPVIGPTPRVRRSEHPRKGNGRPQAPHRETGSTPGPVPQDRLVPRPAERPPTRNPAPDTNSQPLPQVEAPHVTPPRAEAHVDTPPVKVDAQVDQGGASVGAHVQTPVASADVKATVELPDLGVLPKESDRAGSADPVGLGVAVKAPEGPEVPLVPAGAEAGLRARVGVAAG